MFKFYCEDCDIEAWSYKLEINLKCSCGYLMEYREEETGSERNETKILQR